MIGRDFPKRFFLNSPEHGEEYDEIIQIIDLTIKIHF